MTSVFQWPKTFIDLFYSIARLPLPLLYLIKVTVIIKQLLNLKSKLMLSEGVGKYKTYKRFQIKTRRDNSYNHSYDRLSFSHLFKPVNGNQNSLLFTLLKGNGSAYEIRTGAEHGK